eukprot:3476595-Ditylum_brightwellii.AAC.1
MAIPCARIAKLQLYSTPKVPNAQHLLGSMCYRKVKKLHQKKEVEVVDGMMSFFQKMKSIKLYHGSEVASKMLCSMQQSS